MVLWLIGTILLAAILFPWIYQLGQTFAGYGANHELSPEILEDWSNSARRADLGTYFSRSLYASVLILIPCLILRLKALRKTAGVPPTRIALSHRESWKKRITQLFSALIIAAGILWLLGWGLKNAGVFALDSDPPNSAKLIKKALLPALFGSIIEEWLFRGLLLGIWLRIFKPKAALLTVSFIFAFVHFLTPPEHAALAEPSAPFAGFQMLGLIFGHFLNPQFIAAEFLVLFVIGLILGATRIRTGSLWFPIGLHAGWILAFKSFNLLHVDTPSPLRPLWIGESLRSGLLPLAALLVTAVVCHFTLKREKAHQEIPRN